MLSLPFPPAQEKIVPRPLRPFSAAFAKAALTMGAAGSRMPESGGPQEFEDTSIMLGRCERASASCSTVAGAPMRRRPMRDASGATPEMPRLLLPTALAMPAQDVPWLSMRVPGAGLSSSPLKSQSLIVSTLPCRSGWVVCKPSSTMAMEIPLPLVPSVFA